MLCKGFKRRNHISTMDIIPDLLAFVTKDRV